MTTHGSPAASATARAESFAVRKPTTTTRSAARVTGAAPGAEKTGWAFAQPVQVWPGRNPTPAERNRWRAGVRLNITTPGATVSLGVTSVTEDPLTARSSATVMP